MCGNKRQSCILCFVPFANLHPVTIVELNYSTFPVSHIHHKVPPRGHDIGFRCVLESLNDVTSLTSLHCYQQKRHIGPSYNDTRKVFLCFISTMSSCNHRALVFNKYNQLSPVWYLCHAVYDGCPNFLGVYIYKRDKIWMIKMSQIQSIMRIAVSKYLKAIVSHFVRQYNISIREEHYKLTNFKRYYIHKL